MDKDHIPNDDIVEAIEEAQYGNLETMGNLDLWLDEI